MGGVAAESGNSIGLKVVFPSVRFFDHRGRRFERLFSFFFFYFALLANCLQGLFNGWSLHLCMWAWRVESIGWNGWNKYNVAGMGTGMKIYIRPESSRFSVICAIKCVRGLRASYRPPKRKKPKNFFSRFRNFCPRSPGPPPLPKSSSRKCPPKVPYSSPRTKPSKPTPGIDPRNWAFEVHLP